VPHQRHLPQLQIGARKREHR